MTPVASVSATTLLTIRQLRTINFLSDVDEETLTVLAGSVRRRTYKANTALFHTDDPGHVLYMVVSGWVRIEKITATGQTLVIAKRGPGTQLGELSLIDGAPRMADAVTETDCELLTLERPAFLDCLENCPSASLAVIASLAEMIRNSGAHLESVRSQDTLGRLAELLLRYCDSHGVSRATGAIEIGIRLNRQSLADEVGVTRETVSRALSAMASVGAIAKEAHSIVVLDQAKLKRMIAN